MKRGVQELTEASQLGDYLQKVEGGRHIVLRGKFKGVPLDEVPGGYIRHYILLSWADSMNPAEEKLFEHYAQKENNMTDKVKEAFKQAEKTGRAEINLRDVKTDETEVAPIRTEATDEELKESEELVEKVIDTPE